MATRSQGWMIQPITHPRTFHRRRLLAFPLLPSFPQPNLRGKHHRSKNDTRLLRQQIINKYRRYNNANRFPCWPILQYNIALSPKKGNDYRKSLLKIFDLCCTTGKWPIISGSSPPSLYILFSDKWIIGTGWRYIPGIRRETSERDLSGERSNSTDSKWRKSLYLNIAFGLMCLRSNPNGFFWILRSTYYWCLKDPDHSSSCRLLIVCVCIMREWIYFTCMCMYKSRYPLFIADRSRVCCLCFARPSVVGLIFLRSWCV